MKRSSVSLATNPMMMMANKTGLMSLCTAKLTAPENPSNGNREYAAKKGKPRVVRRVSMIEPLTSRSSHVEGSRLIPTFLIFSIILLVAQESKFLIIN